LKKPTFRVFSFTISLLRGKVVWRFVLYTLYGNSENLKRYSYKPT
jgi:hypothetical protein